MKTRSICSKCNKNLVTRKGKTKSGEPIFRTECYGCYKNRTTGLRYRKRIKHKIKKDKCQFCLFVAVDPCQLDVDHIDGNHENNSPDNLQTLCANCHRLKTKLSKEGIYKEG